LDLAATNWSAAEQNLKLVSTLAPSCRDVKLELARLAARQGNWTEALGYENSAQLATIQEISLNDPWLKEVFDLELAGTTSSERADQLLAAGQFAAAAKMLQNVVRDHPELSRARLNLAIVLWQLGNIPESQREFQRLVAQFPDEPTGYLAWGRLLASSGRFQEAKRRVEQAIDKKADAAESNSMGGMIKEGECRLEQAAECYQRAIHAAPETASAYLALAAVYRQLGKPSQANHVLQLAVHLKHPDEIVRREIERQLREAANSKESASALNPANVSPPEVVK
ncbi:MAG: tetratricopeptide repeat protein, partial [Schlesneria sp.]